MSIYAQQLRATGQAMDENNGIRHGLLAGNACYGNPSTAEIL